MRRTILFFQVLILLITTNAKAQCTPPYSDKIFVSVTGTNPYTITAHLGGLSVLSSNWAATTSLSMPMTFTLVAGGIDTVYNTSYIYTPLYYFFRIKCSSGFYENSCFIKLPLDPCDTPKISLSKSPFCLTDTLTLLSSITGTCNRYQWQDSLLGDIAGATSPNLKIIPPILSTNTYRLKYTCPYGTTYSNWLRVSPITTCDTAIVSISKSIGCAGDSLTLKGTGYSACATLQWEDSLSGAIAGATKDSLILATSTTKTSYRLKSTCPLGKVSYSNWIGFTPYTCDSPIVAISSIGGCSGDTLKLTASGISKCTKLQWEDSLSGTIIGATDSNLTLVASSTRNAYRLKTTCPLGKVYYSDWFGFTPYTTCDDSVWAGDVNWDLTVDYLDLLDLGVAYGSVGSSRISPSISWVAQYAKNWASFYPSTVNYKNADCDGNGVVNDDDTLAIYTNYSSVHSIGVIVPKHTKTTGIPDLYFDLTGLSPKAGDIISVPIKLGTASIPVPLIYGIATSIYIDGVPTLSAPMSLDYSSTWIGTSKYKLDLLNSPNRNQLDATYVRKDNNNTSGYGTIGFLTLQVPPATADKTMMHFHFLSAKMIDNKGNVLTNYNILDDSIMVSAATGIKEANNNNFKLYVYPNPSEGKITLTQSVNKFNNAAIKVYDLLGRVVYQSSIQFVHNSTSLNLNVANGTYTLELQDQSGNVQRERIVIH